MLPCGGSYASNDTVDHERQGMPAADHRGCHWSSLNVKPAMMGKMIYDRYFSKEKKKEEKTKGMLYCTGDRPAAPKRIQRNCRGDEAT